MNLSNNGTIRSLAFAILAGIGFFCSPGLHAIAAEISRPLSVETSRESMATRLMQSTLSSSEAPFPSLGYETLPRCKLTTLELRQLAQNVSVDPCILVDTKSELRETTGRGATGQINEALVTIRVVMVTPSSCSTHRDGAALAAQILNENPDRLKIGFYRNVTLQFHFISAIAGNTAALSPTEYSNQHRNVLLSLVEDLAAHYIIGTCSGLAALEKQVALDTKTFLLTAVGPPSFYNVTQNPWVFGVHLNSDEYPLDAARRLAFYASEQNQRQRHIANAVDWHSQIPIRVIYRTKSEFFYSTCASALAALRKEGFRNIQEFLYDHEGITDNDGGDEPVINQRNVDFLYSLADQACPPGSASESFHPALFICSATEQTQFLERFRQNGCRPLSLWLTATTWSWAVSNIDQVPYFQGGAQWHTAMDYSDDYFDRGVDLLLDLEKITGYYGDYDSVVQYSMVQIAVAHLQAAYRIQDHPDPVHDFNVDRERLRRQMITLTANTLFGPVVFDENQRNVGRGAAASQWLPEQASSTGSQISSDEGSGGLRNTTAGEVQFKLSLVSPILQAEAASVLPVPSALQCPPGSFVNETNIQLESALLASKCALCPMDTYTAQANGLTTCKSCPEGTTTNSTIGAVECILYEDQVLAPGVLVFGYCMMGLSLLLCIMFTAWIIRYRQDPVVRLAQTEFLLLICLGAFLSSSSVLFLAIKDSGTGYGGSDSDWNRASRACQTVPFLYTVGWVIQYGSLSSKTFRLYRIMKNTLSRVKVSFLKSAQLVIAAVAIDLIICISWQLTNPVEYVRTVVSREHRDELLVIQTTGSCQASNDGLSMWVFLAPLIVHHAGLMVFTNSLLYCVRNIHSRYQESKYMALASLFVVEVLVIGVAVLVAARESMQASFIVQVGLICLADIGVVSFVFFPKMKFQLEGLAEGVGVGESVMRDTHKKAVFRETVRSQHMMDSGFSSFSVGPSQMEATQSVFVRSVSVASEVILEVDEDSSSSSSSSGRVSPTPMTRSRNRPDVPPIIEDESSDLRTEATEAARKKMSALTGQKEATLETLDEEELEGSIRKGKPEQSPDVEEGFVDEGIPEVCRVPLNDSYHAAGNGKAGGNDYEPGHQSFSEMSDTSTNSHDSEMARLRKRAEELRTRRGSTEVDDLTTDVRTGLNN